MLSANSTIISSFNSDKVAASGFLLKVPRSSKNNWQMMAMIAEFENNQILPRRTRKVHIAM